MVKVKGYTKQEYNDSLRLKRPSFIKKYRRVKGWSHLKPQSIARRRTYLMKHEPEDIPTGFYYMRIRGVARKDKVSPVPAGSWGRGYIRQGDNLDFLQAISDRKMTYPDARVRAKKLRVGMVFNKPWLQVNSYRVVSQRYAKRYMDERRPV